MQCSTSCSLLFKIPEAPSCGACCFQMYSSGFSFSMSAMEPSVMVMLELKAL